MLVAGPVLAIADVSQKSMEPFRHVLNRGMGTSFVDVDKWILVLVAKGVFQDVQCTP